MGDATVVTVGLTPDDLVERVARRVAQILRGGIEEDLVDQDSLPSPLGRREYLEAARRGEFNHSKRGKQVVAKRVDVLAWMQSGKRKSRKKQPEPKKKVSAKEAAKAKGWVVDEPTSAQG